MSLSRYDPSGFSGQSYDRNVFEANLSTVNKLQRDYWNAKQVLRKKLGKEEDKHIVASDSELDAKLELFRSIQTTCADLIKTIDRYQKCVCVLSREENAMGQFLKEQGSLDKTAAGKMMTAVGKAQCYTSQQRLNMRHSLGRLLHDVETFRYRAVSDSVLSVDQMEDARTHYRASLRWMQDISSKLDPEQFKKLEKFRKVQNEVRLNKEKFDRQKWAVCQKVDLLCASRSNLFSNTLVPYQNDILKFWEKTAHTMAAVLENIKDYQNYEFKLLKGLNPLQMQDPASNQEEKEEKSSLATDNDDHLIDLAGDDEGKMKNGDEQLNQEIDNLGIVDQEDRDSLINFYDGDSTNGDVYCEIRMLDQIHESQPLLGIHTNGNGEKQEVDSSMLLDNLVGMEDSQPSKEDLDLLNNILGNEETSGRKDLEQQWESVFGEFVEGPKEDRSTAPTNTDPTQSQPTQQQNSGFLPSQLLDMMSMDNTSGQFGFNQQSFINTGNFGGYQQPNPPSQMMGYQPPTYQSMFGTQANPSPAASQLSQPMTSQNKKDMKGHKSDWFNLFAELDPLQNPDSLGKKKDGDKKDGGAC